MSDAEGVTPMLFTASIVVILACSMYLLFKT